MSRPARSPSSRSGSAACQRRRRPGTASSGSTVGDAVGSVCIHRSRRWGSARLDLTKYATSFVAVINAHVAHRQHCHPSARRDTRHLHAVIDNFSRRILAWRVADTFAPVNSVAVLLEASRSATRSASAPVVLADAGVENVNAQVDALIATGVLRRLLAFTELKFSNSMIEAWWRSVPETSVALPPPAR
jgi:transposase InsO family protein